MSFNKEDEEKERFKTFGDLLKELNEEYNYKLPSKQRITKVVKGMLENLGGA